MKEISDTEGTVRLRGETQDGASPPRVRLNERHKRSNDWCSPVLRFRVLLRCGGAKGREAREKGEGRWKI